MWEITRFVSWVSIMKLCTCFSALVSSNFLDNKATRNAVQPAPYKSNEVQPWERRRAKMKSNFHGMENWFFFFSSSSCNYSPSQKRREWSWVTVDGSTYHNTSTNGNSATTISVRHNIAKSNTQKCDRNQPHGIQ